MHLFSKFLLAIFLCIFTLNCESNKNHNQFIKPPNSIPVLEISQEAIGNFDVTGKILFVRLYENRSVEIEYPNDTKKIANEINGKSEEGNALKRLRLSEPEYQKFATLLNPENFQNLQNEYKRKCCCTDASLNHEINMNFGGNQKRISLVGYCDMSDLKNPQARYNPDFPKILSELMTLVDEMRWKYYSK